VNPRGIRRLGLIGAAFALAAISAACISTEQPTPIYIIVTPTPAPSVEATPTEAPATPTPELSTEPSAEPSAEITPTPTPTPTPTLAPGVTPTPLAGGCVGGTNESNRTFFVQAANALRFTVYCGANMGAGWSLASSPMSTWSGGSHPNIQIFYQYRKTSTRIEICEGTIPSGACAGDTGLVGSANFGPLSGQMYSTADGFAIRVAPGTNHAYTIVGHNLTQSALQTYASKVVAVK
jgi:hypothetical protein